MIERNELLKVRSHGTIFHSIFTWYFTSDAMQSSLHFLWQSTSNLPPTGTSSAAYMIYCFIGYRLAFVLNIDKILLPSLMLNNNQSIYLIYIFIINMSAPFSVITKCSTQICMGRKYCHLFSIKGEIKIFFFSGLENINYVF